MSEEPVVVKLSKTVTSIDRQVSEITLREPRGADLAEAGYPLKFGMGEDKSGRMDVEVMSKLIRITGGISKRAVEQLVFRDWNSCAMAILGFLGEEEAPSEASSTTILN